MALSRDGSEIPVEPDSKAFLQIEQLDRLAAYRQGLVRDRSVVLFYDMGDASGGVVRNLAAASPRENLATHGKISGASLVAGRSVGRQAVRFSRMSDHVAFKVPGELEGLTLAMWVYVEKLHRGVTGLFQTDGWSSEKSGNVHWRIDGKFNEEKGEALRQAIIKTRQ